MHDRAAAQGLENVGEEVLAALLEPGVAKLMTAPSDVAMALVQPVNPLWLASRQERSEPVGAT